MDDRRDEAQFRPGRPGAWGTPTGRLDTEVEGRVRMALSEVSGVPFDRILADAALVDDLGVDSLDAVETCMLLEDAFGCELSDEDIASVMHVGDLVALVELRRPRLAA